jgi:alkanesulfonate monooxygenase SsuD/methylene tetrahydromethanopterin reductase-like flavin-dependent oxidoreductase (luciferase family)
VRIGIGLPTTVPGANGPLLLEWARRADAGPYTSVGVFDRLVYDSFEALTVLAAAAAVTARVALAATVIAAPLRNTALLAKEAATVDSLSGGRLVLGLSLGARKSDYDAAGVEYRTRGSRFTEQLAQLRDLWEDRSIGPAPARKGGPLLLVGGLADSAFVRVARDADGYVHGGGPPRAFARAADRARAAWSDVGRPGKPALWAQGYFALGDDAAVSAGADHLRHYYAFTGSFSERIAQGLLTSAAAVREFVTGYADAGCDELILFPATSDTAQVARLADVLP